MLPLGLITLSVQPSERGCARKPDNSDCCFVKAVILGTVASFAAVLFYVLDAVLGLSTAFARNGELNDVFALQLQRRLYPVLPLALRTGDFVSGPTTPVHLLNTFVKFATEVARHNVCSVVPYIWHHNHASAFPFCSSAPNLRLLEHNQRAPSGRNCSVSKGGPLYSCIE